MQFDQSIADSARRRAAEPAEIIDRRRNFHGAPRLAVIIGLVVKLIICLSFDYPKLQTSLRQVGLLQIR